MARATGDLVELVDQRGDQGSWPSQEHSESWGWAEEARVGQEEGSPQGGPTHHLLSEGPGAEKGGWDPAPSPILHPLSVLQQQQ